MTAPVHRGACPVPAGPVLTRIINGDIVRIQIDAELAALRTQLEAAPANDPLVRSIIDWHNGFWRAMRHPHPQQVIAKFIEELVRLLRDPAAPFGIDSPFPAELFGERPMPIIRYIVEKMRDRRSLFYSEQFDQEAVRVLASVRPVMMEPRDVLQNSPAQDMQDDIDPDIAPELLEQLRQIEANIAHQMQVEAEGMVELHALQARVHQRDADFQRKVDRVAQQHLEEGQRIRAEAERVRLLDLEQRAIIMEAANRLRLEAEALRAEAVRLQRHLDDNGQKINELEKANIQLQVEINNTRAQINDNKSSWMLDAICVVASIAISWVTKKPIVIIPPR